MNLKTFLRRLDETIKKDPLQNEGAKRFFFEVLKHTHSFKNPTTADFITQYGKLVSLLPSSMQKQTRKMLLKALREEGKHDSTD
ncbi:hypothetical protein [Thermotoga sp.]|uniref:hypothetical protein n=1 Tax=Thermotoga sp. TaxID=28240 RepID=UPI0025E373EB|nr:hypothetical protein [Thermotoga sp.]